MTGRLTFHNPKFNMTAMGLEANVEAGASMADSLLEWPCAHARQQYKVAAAFVRRKRASVDAKKKMRASRRKHCTSALRAPQAFENAALRHKQLHAGGRSVCTKPKSSTN